MRSCQTSQYSRLTPHRPSYVFFIQGSRQLAVSSVQLGTSFIDILQAMQQGGCMACIFPTSLCTVQVISNRHTARCQPVAVVCACCKAKAIVTPQPHRDSMQGYDAACQVLWTAGVHGLSAFAGLAGKGVSRHLPGTVESQHAPWVTCSN